MEDTVQLSSIKTNRISSDIGLFQINIQSQRDKKVLKSEIKTNRSLKNDPDYLMDYHTSQIYNLR